MVKPMRLSPYLGYLSPYLELPMDLQVTRKPRSSQWIATQGQFIRLPGKTARQAWAGLEGLPRVNLQEGGGLSEFHFSFLFYTWSINASIRPNQKMCTTNIGLISLKLEPPELHTPAAERCSSSDAQQSGPLWEKLPQSWDVPLVRTSFIGMI